MDSHPSFRPAPVPGASSLGPLFDAAPEPTPAVNVPDIRTPAPAAPGSDSSQAAADAIDGPFRRKSYREIMLTLGALSHGDCLSMAEISEATGIPVNVICARLRVGELRPLWVEAVPGARVSLAKSSLKVDGFRLTSAGRNRLKGAA